ncbi:hypothetical protein [Laspinema olomoucense]|uniref:hypothetical protein n=1 Tax=Laspinema olomoucense TaxID=3231600 RepID=UPI0021BAC5B5|nr:hypothetical protein [Laspinema sp. D3a]MCT7990603.1 hypothetical protein [Laspinema sp. D3a]
MNSESRVKNLLNPSLEQLIDEIHAVNHAWKVALAFGDIPALATSLQDMKTRLQVRLLRQYAPDRVYLALDTETASEEPLYGLRLREPIAGYTDAAHLPVRVAQDYLSHELIEGFKKL